MREQKISAREFLAELQDIYNIIARNNERMDLIASQATLSHAETWSRLDTLVSLAKDAAGVPDPDHYYDMQVWQMNEAQGIPRVWAYSVGRVTDKWNCRFEWPVDNVNYWDIELNFRRRLISFSLPGQGPCMFPFGPLGQWVEYRPQNVLVKVMLRASDV